jgi:hypothetical protein
LTGESGLSNLRSVVASAGLVSAITCLCLPTSVAICAYAWIVYTNADVRRAFATRGGLP